MKILFTGFQGRQRSEKSYKKDYAPTARYTIRMLRDLGHKVVVDQPELGDKSIRDSYDLAFVGLNGYSQLSSLGGRFPALWVMSQLPHVAFIDDWQLEVICSQLWRPSDSPWRQDDEHSDRAIQMDEIHAVIEHLTKLPSVLIPIQGWGDSESIREHHPRIGRVFDFDPTPWVFDELEQTAAASDGRARKRAWFCTSLSNVDSLIKRDKLAWSVEGYWDKKRHTYIPEREVIDVKLQEYAAVYCPSHFKGCKVRGWFRCRWAHYAFREIPICADHDEIGYLADAAAFPSGAEMENMSDCDLIRLGREQSEAIVRMTASKQEELGLLHKAIIAARTEAVCAK